MNIFMGSYQEVIQAVYETLGIALAMIETKNEGDHVHRYCQENNIPVKFVKDSSDVTRVIAEQASVDYCFVASFGLLLKSEAIAGVRAIYNFHPGDVYVCRGRHPLPYAIKLGQPAVALSVHLIDDERIDAGPLVARLQVALDYSKNYTYNDARLRRFLRPVAMDLCRQLAANGEVATWAWRPDSGSYYPPLDRSTLNCILNAPTLEEFKE